MLINLQIFSLIISVMHFLRGERKRESNADFFIKFATPSLEQLLDGFWYLPGGHKCWANSSVFLTSSPVVKEICLTSRTWAWCQYLRSKLTSIKSPWQLSLTSRKTRWFDPIFHQSRLEILLFPILGFYFAAPPKKMPKTHPIIEHILIFL